MIHLIAFFKSNHGTYAYHFQSDKYSDIQNDRKELTQLTLDNHLLLATHTIRSSVSGFVGIQHLDPYFKDMILVSDKRQLANLYLMKKSVDS